METPAEVPPGNDTEARDSTVVPESASSVDRTHTSARTETERRISNGTFKRYGHAHILDCSMIKKR